MWGDLQQAMYRVVLAATKFIVSLLISGLLVGAGIALETLVSFSIQDGSTAHEIVGFVLDVSLVGSAVVVSVCGALLVAGEAVASTYEYLSGLKD